MFSLSNLRTSQIESLKQQLADGQGIDELVSAARRFLEATPVDGGADSDLIFVAGKRLASHDVWSYVPAATLKAALQGIATQAVDLFLKRAPEAYREVVLTKPKANLVSTGAVMVAAADRIGLPSLTVSGRIVREEIDYFYVGHGKKVAGHKQVILRDPKGVIVGLITADSGEPKRTLLGSAAFREPILGNKRPKRDEQRRTK